MNADLTKFDLADEAGYGIIRTGIIGIGTSYSTSNLLTCDSTQVAFIDQLVIQGWSADIASNTTVVIEINGVEMPFHIAGTVNARRFERLVWNTRGALVLHPGQTLRVKAPTYTAGNGSNTFERNIYVTGRYRIMPLLKAMQEGYFDGGTMPAVTTTLIDLDEDGSGTVADTAEMIISPLAGHYVEVMGFAITGHNYNTALDSTLLTFWDGDGTIGSDGSKLFRAYHRGVGGVYQSKVLIGNTKGCIQGPSGDGLYVTQTSNVADATNPKVAVNVIYRYRKTTECAINTGASLTSGSKKWWRYVESTTTGTTAFGSGLTPCGIRVRGQAISMTGADNFTGNGKAQLLLGASTGWGQVFEVQGDGNGAAAGMSVGVDDEVLICGSAQDPRFGIVNTASAITGLGHLVWGTMHADIKNATSFAAGGTSIRDTWTA